jgi:hypothetical protein
MNAGNVVLALSNKSIVTSSFGPKSRTLEQANYFLDLIHEFYNVHQRLPHFYAVKKRYNLSSKRAIILFGIMEGNYTHAALAEFLNIGTAYNSLMRNAVHNLEQAGLITINKRCYPHHFKPVCKRSYFNEEDRHFINKDFLAALLGNTNVHAFS